MGMSKIADSMLEDTGTMPAWDGSALTNLSAGNMVAGGAFPAIDGSALTGISTGAWARSTNQSVSSNTSSVLTKITLTIEEQSSDSIFSISSGNIVTSTSGKYRLEGRTALADGKDNSNGSAYTTMKIGTSVDGSQVKSANIGQNFNENNSGYPDHPICVSFWDIFTLGSGTHYISLHWLSTTFWNSGSHGFYWMLTKL